MKAASAQVVSCCVYENPQKIMQHIHGDIPLLFDFRTNPIVLLLLPKSSTSGWTVSTEFFSKKNILAIAENTWWAFLSQF